MAYVYGSKVKSKWRAFISYSVTTNNDTTYSISVSAGLDTDGSGYKSSNASCTLSGTDQASYSVRGKSASGRLHVMVGPYTYTWTKGTSAVNKTVTAVTKTSGGTVAPGTSTATLTITVPQKTSYTVAYNANNGTGAPSAQTKWYDTALTLSTTKPTRTGYTFSKWNTNASGTGSSYSSGGSYTANAAATLYAIWTANTYGVTFNANGGSSGTTTSMNRSYGSSFTIPQTAIPTRTNYKFLGWSTSNTATTPTYTHTGGTSGTCTISTYNTSTNTLTLYAVWELLYIAPVISNLTVYRVKNATSTKESDDGTYIYASFNYKAGEKNAAFLSPSYNIKIDGTSVGSGNLSINSSGQGSFSKTYGSSYSPDISHTVVVTVSDSTGSKTTTTIVAPATYPIDLIADGNDVYMGIMTPAVVGQMLKIWVDAIYPVGSYYETSDTAFNPNTYFGGTWVLEDGGRVHISSGKNIANTTNSRGSYPAGTNTFPIGERGGEPSHVLTIDQMPSHAHTPNNWVVVTNSNYASYGDRIPGGTGGAFSAKVNAAVNPDNYISNNTGGGLGHNNMQPYTVVNRWHRTA